MSKHVPGYVLYKDRARGKKIYQPTINGQIVWGHYFKTATKALEFAREIVKEKENEGQREEPDRRKRLDD